MTCDSCYDLRFPAVQTPPCAFTADQLCLYCYMRNLTTTSLRHVIPTMSAVRRPWSSHVITWPHMMSWHLPLMPTRRSAPPCCRTAGLHLEWLQSSDILHMCNVFWCTCIIMIIFWLTVVSTRWRVVKVVRNIKIHEKNIKNISHLYLPSHVTSMHHQALPDWPLCPA